MLALFVAVTERTMSLVGAQRWSLNIDFYFILWPTISIILGAWNCLFFFLSG
jgi:hypothetical protein